MSLTAIICHQVEHISKWTSSTWNNILTMGNNLYVSISKDFYGMPYSFGKCTLLSIKGLKNLYHICKCLAQKYGLFLLKSEVFHQWLSTWFEKWLKWQRVIGQNIAHNHSRLTIAILPCTAYTVIAAFLRALSARNLSETHACYTKKNPCVAERGDYSQFLVVLNFPFVFQNTHIPVFFLYGCDRN